MSHDVKTLRRMLSPGEEQEVLVRELVHDYTNMINGRAGWEEECRELDAFLYATDTRSTTNSKLPFSNSTTIPKLAQIYQNMITAYIEHLIPNRDWVGFEAMNSDDATKEKADAAKHYVRSKMEESNYEGVLERLVTDYIKRGIAVEHTRHVKRMTVTVEGQIIPHYTGTVAERIHPSDFLYDVTASSLDSARKCIRSTYTMGSLRKHIEEETNPVMTLEQFNELRETRRGVRGSIDDNAAGRRKFAALAKDGFGDVLNYINEGLVEVLHFYGDFYDEDNDELMVNYEITLIDRKMIGRKQPMSTWDNSQNIHVSVWDYRSDSLAPMGPLSRLVGMQYKLDKRENLKEDIHDRFANPTIVKIGDVKEKGVRGGPRHEYVAEEKGDVKFLFPPAEALRGDDQLGLTLSLMEDLSGSPKESIGQRTPGEKTKFEVQILDQGQSKLFRRKVKKFEREIVTPTLQDTLEQGRHHMDATDVVRSFNTTMGTTEFTNITADDLNSTGRMVARGATLFAEKANALQNLAQILGGGPLAAELLPHISRERLFRAVEDLGDLGKYDLFTFGIGIQDQGKLQRMAAKVQDSTTASELTQESVDGTSDIA